jgi:hypothetical protein
MFFYNYKESMIRVFLCDYETGTKYRLDVDANTTLGDLKEKFCTIKKSTKVEEIYAWVGSPLVVNNMTLEQYNIAFDNVVVNFATDWSEEMKAILEYYL